jgi:peptidylprolyl isomerase
MAIENGNWVAISYKGTLKDGTLFDTSEGRAPLVFQVGAGTVIKGFDDNVKGLEVGVEKTFTIPCKEAYGEHSDDRKENVPLDFFKEVKPEVGMMFMVESPMGPLKIKVLTIQEKDVTVSLNHPLAGEDLTFSIKVEKLLTPEEVEAQEKASQQTSEGCSCDNCSEEGCGADCDCSEDK